MAAEYIYASDRQVALAKLEVKIARKLGKEPDPVALELAHSVLVDDSAPSTETRPGN